MTLQHELRIACSGIPELNAAVLGPGEYPVSIWGESDGENKVLLDELV